MSMNKSRYGWVWIGLHMNGYEHDMDEYEQE